MFSTKMYRLLTGGKALLLAYDQGLEHGPVEFNLHNINPNYILDIAEKGGYNGVILQQGLAEKYYQSYKKSVRLVLKLNGKTSIPKTDPYSPQLCSVKRAVNLGADAVGYTIYSGSPLESKMFSEFGKIVEEAHDFGIPVIAWMYPRGPFVKDENSTEILAYAARVGLELGADMIKIKYNRDLDGFKWAVKAAGKCKVLVAGGQKENPEELFKEAKQVMDAGAAGMAIGRNIWQHPDPLRVTKALRKIVIEGAGIAEAMKAYGKQP